MRFPRLLFGALVVLICVEAKCAVVISEVMFDPAGEESSDEFIELYNNSSLPVLLTGWTISDAEGIDTLMDAGQGLIAAPRQHILVLDPDYIEDGSMTYDGLVPEAALVVTIDNGTFGSRGLSNSEGELIGIKNSSGAPVDDYHYTVGNLPGHSDERVRMDMLGDPTNWHDSSILNGTPGFRNSVTPLDRDLGLLRVTSDPMYPESNTSFNLSLEIANLGLQSLSSSLLVKADSSNSAIFYEVTEVAFEAIAPGDSASIFVSIGMPSSGIILIETILNISDDDTTNNRLHTVVSAIALLSGLRINELQSNPITGHAEWVELTSVGQNVLSTRGMFIAEGNGVSDPLQRSPLPDWVITPGEFVIVSDDSSIFLENTPLHTKVHVISESFSLNNIGDSIAVYSPDGRLVDRVDYRQNWGNAEPGVSIERVSLAAATDIQANWGSSMDLSGSTPGRVNSRSIAVPDKSTSLTVEPSPFTPNGDGVDEVVQIQFSTAGADASASVSIYDSRGRFVRKFTPTIQGGTGAVLWDGKRDNGEMSSTGRYIILLEAKSENGTMISDRTTLILARPE